MNVSFNEYDVWNNEGTVDLVEGAVMVFTCKVWSAVSGNPTAACTKGGQTVTSTVFAAGTITPSDKTFSLTAATFATYGTYVITVTCTIGSETVKRKIQVRVQKAKAIR